ncbi:LTA synthase family protein [Collinsella tanakaei]|uniref:LTA synthase family protein n=1 Tax=Collinsella tanakaei TaxID=626935 RepID=UPI0019595438|nr:LTA synthase family protein [Collinsella tanakaei]MBM6867665.1 sulfatase-like hydrolase/transferase [Collinsella tanakaei]
MVVTIITCVGLICTLASALGAVRHARAAQRTLAPGAIGWGVAFLLMQAFIAVWSGIGLVQDDVLSALVANIALTGCAAASFNRHAIATCASAAAGDDADGSIIRRHPLATTIVLLLIATVCSVLALELPSNHDLTWIYPPCLLLEIFLVGGLLAGLFFLFGRRGVASGILAFALFFIGIAEYFVILFKSMPISPGDLSALSTAAAVAGSGYTYTLSAFCLYGLAFCAIALLSCEAAGCLRPARALRSRRSLIINLVVGIALIGAVGAHAALIDYYNTLGITIYTWRPLESYYRQGFLPAFISGAQTINPPKPAGYKVSEAEELVDKYAAAYDEDEATNQDRAAAETQFNEEKPTVIAIMNETFSDLSIYQMLHADYTGPSYFKSLSNCLARGTLYVSAYGGGTANTEFEFLTGNSMANLGSGVYPYTIYNLSDVGNLAQQFKDLGYDTLAMHPNHATNWNRENVYEDFGFDEFLSIDDFEDSETLRGMVTDSATYDTILEQLESNSNPQFIFDVTMQNHSGYETNLIPSDKRVELSIDGMSNAEVNEYISLIQESDRALAEFIGKLRQLDRKVVVVFFGDHQPYFPSTFNDLWFTDEDPAVHQERLWQTDYIIWANYDVAGNDQTSEVDDLSVNYLGAKLMEVIGAPLSTYQKALMSLREALPAINTTGFEDADGTWYLTGDDTGDTLAAQAANAARKDYAIIQYYEMFYDGKSIYTKRKQSAANETDPNLDPGTTQIK